MTLKLVRPLPEAALSEKITALDELVRDIETAHDVPALRAALLDLCLLIRSELAVRMPEPV